MDSALTSLMAQLRYRLLCRRISRLPEREQMRCGKAIYDAVWDAYAKSAGDRRATCTVRFACPYPVHVSHHLVAGLETDVADRSCPTTGYDLDSDGCGNYMLTLRVSTSAEHPELVADAAAMAAILSVPTVSGELRRTAWTTTDERHQHAQERQRRA